MPTKKYRFVSPGVQTSETDLTIRNEEGGDVGALILGRTERGPSFTPVQVNTFQDFVRIFGKPIPGGGTLGNDVWRDGNYSAPTYGAYAAQAYLKNQSPVTFVRITGDQHDNATSAGAAGWPQDAVFTPNAIHGNNAGAFGLFIINSGTIDDYSKIYNSRYSYMTGGLAAIFYMRQGCSIRLDGTNSYGKATSANPNALSGAGELIQSEDHNKTFKAIIENGSGSNYTASFNFNPDSDIFIRKVFNTNPILTNTTVTDSTTNLYKKYWLGETYEDFIDRQVTSGSVSGSVYGLILPIMSSSAHGGDYRFRGKRARTGWIFSQDLSNNFATFMSENMTKLFRFWTHTADEWAQKNLKISIANVKPSKNLSNQYGTFDVEIREISDNDQAKRAVERFVDCDLNPFSENYVAKKIGNKYREWNHTNKEFTEYGDYDNNSSFVYIEVNSQVEQAMTDPRLLPFGFYGTPRFHGLTATRTYMLRTSDLKAGRVVPNNVFVRGTGSLPHAPSGSTTLNTAGTGICLGTFNLQGLLNFDTMSASFEFPRHPLVSSSRDVRTTTPFDAYFGIDVYRNGSTRIVAENHKDLVRPLPEGYDEDDTASVEVAYYFTLDNLRQHSGSSDDGSADGATSTWYADVYHESGSRVLGKSITATGSQSPLTVSTTSSYSAILDAGFNKFTLPLYGGFEGFDITEKEPLRNSKLLNGTETTNYAFYSVQRALDGIADPEVVEYEIAAIPGITDQTVTRKLLDICEDRGDALAIIDLKGDYTPFPESTATEANRLGNIDTTVTNLRDRGINSSYGAAYYPWVKIKDTLNGNTVTVPPSVAALGAMGVNDKIGEKWTAPAGYNRGRLSDQRAGVPVVGVKQRLSLKNRDKLYAENINPIASFTNDGIVLMGQKTLQTTPSALDRINVRRLLIHCKRVITGVAKNLLFDQNVKSTWNRFVGKVKPFLESIKSRFGLERLKLVLDETTTTEELRDRNMVYGEIHLVPVGAIEFIALDFSISPAGAFFND